MTTIYVVDAFTTKPNTGNRAGVVLDADHLTTQEMQDIAAFAGYSETAFVLSPKDQSHDIHVRYFTPTHEVPICGHATIATHFLRATTVPIRLSINRKNRSRSFTRFNIWKSRSVIGENDSRSRSFYHLLMRVNGVNLQVH